jgi:hypothetical protein
MTTICDSFDLSSVENKEREHFTSQTYLFTTLLAIVTFSSIFSPCSIISCSPRLILSFSFPRFNLNFEGGGECVNDEAKRILH